MPMQFVVKYRLSFIPANSFVARTLLFFFIISSIVLKSQFTFYLNNCFSFLDIKVQQTFFFHVEDLKKIINFILICHFIHSILIWKSLINYYRISVSSLREFKFCYFDSYFLFQYKLLNASYCSFEFIFLLHSQPFSHPSYTSIAISKN